MNIVEKLEQILSAELLMDRAYDDVTTLGVFGEKIIPSAANVVSKDAGVFFGAEAVAVVGKLYPELEVNAEVKNGAGLKPKVHVASLKGPLQTILTVERTLLNVLSHLSGVATLTRQYVDETAGSTKILATRKTLPGLRELQLAAVVAGGGFVHRRSLSDGILIKDNHLIFASPTEALTGVRQRRSPLHAVELEIDDLKMLGEISDDCAPDVVMLDNLELQALKQGIAEIRSRWPRCQIEVSGGIQKEQVKAICELGVDYISVGALTHSAPSFDFSLEVISNYSNSPKQ